MTASGRWALGVRRWNGRAVRFASPPALRAASGALGAVIAVGAVGALVFLIGKPEEVVISRYATSLDGRTRSQRHNADLALSRLNGVVIQPGQIFSFNSVVGTFSRDQGYRKAPVSYNGQLVSSWGGGVCHTSQTVYT